MESATDLLLDREVAQGFTGAPERSFGERGIQVEGSGSADVARQNLLNAHGAEIRVVLDALEHTGRFDRSGQRRSKLETALRGLALEAGQTH